MKHINKKIAELVLYIIILLIGLILIAFALFYASNKSYADGLNISNKASNVRIKDVIAVEGVRENILIGYGLVVGLNGTGDKFTNSAFTEKSLKSFLEKLGVNTMTENLKPKNVAAVTVTAKLPAFARAGSKIDVNVSAMGDARSLEGGTLIATPLLATDGQVYAIAQGSITISAFEAKAESATLNKGIPTNGSITNGAIIEREVAFNFNDMETMDLSLFNPDFSTAYQIKQAIDANIGKNIAHIKDPGTIEIATNNYDGGKTELLNKIGLLNITPDERAKIVIDEASGTIVINKNVRLSSVAVAQGNLVISITEEPVVSQPNPFAPEGAETILAEKSNIEIKKTDGTGKPGEEIAMIEKNANLKELVDALNALGVSPRDLITILQNIKQAGALQAEIIVR